MVLSTANSTHVKHRKTIQQPVLFVPIMFPTPMGVLYDFGTHSQAISDMSNGSASKRLAVAHTKGSKKGPHLRFLDFLSFCLRKNQGPHGHIPGPNKKNSR